MKNYRLDITYDGSNYSGWQSQKNSRTIEDTLKEALKLSNIKYYNLIASGRTDAGVHANKQVVSFKSDTTIPDQKIKLALNSKLPEEIKILNSQEVPDDFNARYNAVGKAYTYFLNLNSIPSPIANKYSWHFPYPIDKERLKYACQFLSGEHDYINFRSTGSSVKTTIRCVDIIKPTFLPNNYLRIDFIGNGFLYNMVRILVGTIMEYANYRISEDQLHQVFLKHNRELTGITAPAHGLFLNNVFYDLAEKNNKIIEIKSEIS